MKNYCHQMSHFNAKMNQIRFPARGAYAYDTPKTRRRTYKGMEGKVRGRGKR